ncbi:MAG: 4Fe-4S dicluster domain-containing protein [Defluviitaleaceae bacterium]|nr:4Fe-4S dicluster domain-containing protein [Defluviitaleaceae bacterium]
MYRVTLEGLKAVFAHLSLEMGVYAPLRDGNELNYGLYSDSTQVDLDGLKSLNTPKDLILPQSEDLYKAKLGHGKIEITSQNTTPQPFAIFGIKACDIKAIEVLDNIYLKGDFVDDIYKARREQVYLVSLACKDPGATCFCAAFGLDAANPGGDVATWIIDDYVYFEGQTDKGTELLKKITHLLEKTIEEDVEVEKHEVQQKVKALPYVDLDLSHFKGENTMEIFNDEKWDKIYGACLGCGVCTYICPTCSCYDIRDFEGKCGEIQKFRCWDSCMYPEFTLMAHGNNRNSQKERFRQRFMHKLVYHHDKFAEHGCVGCGRCVNKCPAQLNIIKIIKTFGGAN